MDGPNTALHWLDYAIVVAYFVGVIAHGVWVSRRNKGSSDSYFLAGRNLPWYLIGFSLFASNMSGASFVGIMGGAYADGLVIFNYEWTASIILLLSALFILPTYLRAKVSTIPEYLEMRYDVRARRAFSIFTLLAIMFIDTAAALYAGGLVISDVIGPLNLWSAIGILALVAGIYTILGGLSAVVVTDTVQAIILIAAAAILFWIGLDAVGGYASLMEGLSPRQTSLILPPDDPFLPWTGMLGVLFIGFYYWTFNQFVAQRTLGARSLREGRLGAIFGGFLKLPNLFLMVMPGLIALKLYPELSTPDLAFPTLAFDLMPIGIRGLIMAALIAAIMSSLDSALNAAGTLFTLDFVKPFRPNMSEKRLVVIGKIATGVAMVIGAIYAPMIASFGNLFSYLQTSLAYIVPPVVSVYCAGLFFPKLNATGAFWTILTGLVVGISLFLVREVFTVWADLGLPDIHFTLMAMYLGLGALVLHTVLSLFGQPRPVEEIEKVIYSGKDAARDFGGWHKPWVTDYKILSALLFAATAGMILWYW